MPVGVLIVEEDADVGGNQPAPVRGATSLRNKMTGYDTPAHRTLSFARIPVILSSQVSSPAPSHSLGSQSYEQFYGFVQAPFTLTPDPRFLYRSHSHEEAITLLVQALRRKEGFIVLTGDIGTGKTTVCRALLQQLDATTFTSLVLNPFLSVEELLREALLDFGVLSREAVRSGRIATASTHELVSTLHDFLLSLVAINGSAVLIIDEAQHLSAQVLEQIRVLSNLETNEAKLLQIVLVGQLNLLDILSDSQMRQLDQRISIRATLKALTREEVEAYIGHRLWVARGSTSASFTSPALDLVHRYTGGVPRIINLLCDRALMKGAMARQHELTPEFVRQGAESLGLEMLAGARGRFRIPLKWPSLPRWVVLSLAGGAAMLGILTLLLLFAPLDRLIDVTLPAAPPAPRPVIPASIRPKQVPTQNLLLPSPIAPPPAAAPTAPRPAPSAPPAAPPGFTTNQ